MRPEQQCCAVERAPHLNRVDSEISPLRRREGKAMPAAAESSAFEVFAITIGQDLADQPAPGRWRDTPALHFALPQMTVASLLPRVDAVSSQAFIEASHGASIP